jgi:AraC-like DNA-binding protein
MKKLIQRPVVVLPQLKTERVRLHLKDNKKNIIKNIRMAIRQMIYFPDDIPDVNYSDYISKQLNYDYTYLSNVFCSETGVTIQQSIIILKISRVKELLLFNELSLTQISHKLHYSSVSHLSNQFRKITGLSPSSYKQAKRRQVAIAQL